MDAGLEVRLDAPIFFFHAEAGVLEDDRGVVVGAAEWGACRLLLVGGLDLDGVACGWRRLGVRWGGLASESREVAGCFPRWVVLLWGRDCCGVLAAAERCCAWCVVAWVDAWGTPPALLWVAIAALLGRVSGVSARLVCVFAVAAVDSFGGGPLRCL